MAAMFFHGSKFREQSLKRITQGTILWNYFKIWQAVSEEKNFEEFIISPYSEKSLPHPHPSRFSTDQNFANNFWKGSHKKQACEIIAKSDQRFQRRRFLKISLKKIHFVAMATTVFDGIKFCEQSLKRTTQGTFLPSLVQIGPAV